MAVTKHSNARSRNISGLAAWLLNATLVLGALLGATWSQQAQAFSCDISSTGVTTQTGPVNTTLTYSFSIPGTCSAPTESGTITAGSDTTGGASVSPTWSDGGTRVFNVVVTLGPNGGGSATFTVNDNCVDCGGGSSTVITASTQSGNCDLASIAPTNQSAGTGAVLNYSFGVSSSFNCDNAGGSSGTISTTDNTSGALLSQTTFSHVLSGGTVPFTETLGSTTGTETITIQATKNISTTNTLNYTATVGTPSITNISGDGQINYWLTHSAPVVVEVDDATATGISGDTITWSVDPASAAGAAVTFDSTTTSTNGAGQSSNAYTVTTNSGGPLSLIIDAKSSTTGLTTQFDQTILFPDATNFAKSSGDGQNGNEGATLPILLDVVASNQGAAAIGAPITWAVQSGDATTVISSAATSTDSTGSATAQITLGTTTPGAVVIRATRTDTGASVDFNLVINNVYLLIPAPPATQSVSVGQVANLAVQYTINGTGVNSFFSTTWNSPSGGTLGSPGLPDPSGNFFNTFSSATPGTYVITVDGTCYPSPGNGCPPPQVSFTVNVVARTITTDSTTDNQTAAAGQPFTIPLKVHVLDNSAAPSAPVGVNWIVSSGSASLSGSSSPTDVNGDVTVNVTAGASAGPVTITAQRQDDTSITTSFSLTVTAASPAMTVTKVFTGSVDNDSSTTVTQGDQLNYSVTMDNTGNVPLNNVVVSDDHFAGTQTCVLVNVGGNCVLTGSYIVAAGDVTAGSVVNTGSAVSTEITTPVNSLPVTTTVVGSPAMTVAKILTGFTDNDGSTTVTPGDALNYTVTMTNTGNVALTNVVVSDDHFAATQSCPSVAVGNTCVLTGSYTALASDVAPGVTNTGSAVSTEITTPVNSTPVLTAVNPTPAPAMTVAKILTGFTDNDGSTTVTPGDALNYTVTMTNTGNVALTNVVVSDDHFAATQSCPSVAVGNTCVLTGSYTALASDVAPGVTNTGSAVSTEITTPVNSTPVLTAVNPTPAPAMTVAKILTGFTDNDGSTTVTPGDALNYTVTMTNTGNVALTNVVVSDDHFAATQSCPSVAVGNTCVLTGSYTALASDVAPGVTNTGSAVSTEITTPVNSTPVLTAVNPTPAPAMTVAKILTGFTDNDGSTTVTPGDALNYTVTMTNTGNVALTNVVVSDDHFAATQSCPSVAVGNTCVLTGSYTALASDVAPGVTNTGSAVSTEITTPVNSTPVLTAVNPTPAPAMTVAKILTGFTDNDGSTTVTPGDALNYTVTMTNTGNVALTNVVVSDDHFAATQSCPSVAVGNTCVLTGSYTALASDVAPGVTNTGSAVSTEITTPVNSTPVLTAVNPTPAPAMTVAKILTGFTDNDGSTTVTPGDALNYTVTMTNTGNVALTNVVVSDDHFAATQSCPSVAVGNTCVLTGSYTALASDVAPGVTNTGSAVSTEITTPVNSTPVLTAVNPTPAPAMTVAKILTGFTDNDGSTTVTPGDALNYTVTMTNTGNVALTNVVVSDDHFAATQSCPSVAVGNTCVLTGSYTALASDVAPGVTNTGSAVSTEITTPVNSTPVLTAVNPTPAPAMTVAKILTGFTDNDGSTTVTPGDALNYTVTMTNTGNVALTNVVVSDDHFAATQSCPSVAVGNTCVLTGSYTALASDVASGVTNTGSAVSTEITTPVNSTPVVTAVGTLRTLVINFGNGASGAPNAVIPIEVTASDNGAPVAGVQINWALVSGSATLSSNTGTTDASGWSPIDVDLGPTNGPRTVVISATRNDDPTATVTFTLNVTAITRTLVISGGNNQTGPSNAALPAPLAVHALDNGSNAPGITINWAVTGGSATVSPTSTTDAAGLATVSLTFGATPGTVTVTGTRADDPTATVTFTETSTLSRTLTIVSGNGLVGGPGATLPALVVNAQDNGIGAPGVTINWAVTGDAVLGPGQVSAASGAGPVSATAAATLSTFASTTNASGNASVTVTLGTTPGTITVTGTRADDPTVSVSFSVSIAALSTLPGLTPEEHAIAIALDNACAALAALPSRTANQEDLYQRCLDLVNATTLDPTDVVNALDEMFPDLALVEGDAGLSAAQAQFQNLKARIAALRSGTQGSSFGGLALTNATGTITLDGLMTAFSDEKKPEVGSDFSRWGFFASGTIGRANAKPGQFTPAYSYDIDGLTAGVDYRESDKLIFGGAVGFTNQNTDLKNNEGSVKTTGWSVSGYGTYYRENSWYTDAVLTFGHNNYDTKRVIDYSLPLPGGGTTEINQTARSSSGGNMFEGAFTFGRDFQRGALDIGPYGRLLYTRVDFGQINETLNPGAGSGLGVSIDSHNLTSFASQIGAKFSYAHSTSWGVLMPHAQLEWEHEFKSDPQAITARFLNDPTSTPISFKGDVRDTDFFKLGVGMSMVMAHGRSGFFYVEDLLGRNGYSQYNLALGLRIEF